MRLRTERLIRPIKRLALWHVDGAVRYGPAVRLIRRHGRGDSRILEVGSGRRGLTLFLPRPIVGCDVEFTGPSLGLIDPVRLDPEARELPFKAGSFDFVVSMDTLEHVPPADRPGLVRELARVSRGWVILGFPSGEGAAAYDRRLYEHIKRRFGLEYRWTLEHLELGLPDAGAVAATLRGELDMGRGDELWVEDNFNVDSWLRAWKFQMSRFKPWRSVLNKLLWPLVPRLRRRDCAPAYRKVLIARKGGGAEAGRGDGA